MREGERGEERRIGERGKETEKERGRGDEYQHTIELSTYLE